MQVCKHRLSRSGSQRSRARRAGLASLLISLSGVAHAHAWAIQPERSAQQPTGEQAREQAAKPESYIRVVDAAEGGEVRLEVAVRRFVSDNQDWPAISLAGAVHIGDRSFYERLQHAMEAHDVILFESVKPSGMGELTPDTPDEERVRITERRIRFLTTIIERQRAKSGALPESLEALAASMDDRFAALLAGARVDAWGNELLYQMRAEGMGFDVLSFGADGEQGGEGLSADLAFSSQKPLTAAERGEAGPGVQKQLAEALGLVFQPEAMDEGGPKWRNSDMSVDQVQRRLEEEGVEGDQLFRMLSGESMAARFATFLLRLATSTDQSRAMTKLAMMEMLSNAEALLTAGQGDTGKMMKVIINDRNEVVLRDLKAILQDEPDIRTVGILYGAGHLSDIELRLAELGYTPRDQEWIPAMTVELASAGLTPEQASAMRDMMKRSVEQQLRATQRRR